MSQVDQAANRGQTARVLIYNNEVRESSLGYVQKGAFRTELCLHPDVRQALRMGKTFQDTLRSCPHQ